MKEKTVIVNLVIIINQDGTNTPYYGFRDMVHEYKSTFDNNNSDIYFIYFYMTNIKFTSIIYKMVQEIESKSVYLKKIKIPRDELNIGTSDTLKDFLDIIFADNKYENWNKIFVTYSHGTGFSIAGRYVDDTIDINQDKIYSSPAITESKNEIINSAKKMYYSFLNRNKKEQRVNATALTIEELAVAIKSSEAKKFDAILFGSCYMQTTDTYYALREVTKYIVATETTFSWQGYNYSMLNEIVSEITDQTMKNFADQSFDKIDDLLKGYDAISITKEEMSLSVLKTEMLGENNELLDYIKKFIAIILKDIKTYHKKLYQSAIECEDYTSHDLKQGLRDFIKLVKIFKTKINDSNLQNLIAMIENSYNAICINLNNGEKLLPEENYGISINFPVTREELDGYYYTFTNPYEEDKAFQSSFSIESKWGLLLKEIVSRNINFASTYYVWYYKTFLKK